jgi:hypothetical protein
MPRVDLFTAIHKGIRALVYDQSSALQSADLGDETEGPATLARVEHTLELLHEHSVHEDRFVFSELRRFDPGLVDELQGAHRTIGKKIDAVRAAAAQTRAATKAAKLETGAEVNRRFNELIAFYLSHNNDEERRAVAATASHFTDEELTAMRLGIQGSQAPERAAEWASWMLPALNVPEVAGMLAGIRASVPPSAFEGMKQMARQALGDDRWRKVALAAGL